MATEEDIRLLLRAIGERVRTRRKALGLTQEKLAEQVDLSPTYVAKLEAGQKTASLETIVALSSALEMDPGDLVGRRADSVRMERAANLAQALEGLSEQDMQFIEQELLHLAAYLRNRG